MAMRDAIRYGADLGTVIGNGLTFGRGMDIKQTLGWAGQNAAKGVGLMEGDYIPLKDYLQAGAEQLDAARQNVGSVGSLAETGAGLAGGGVAALLGLKAASKLPAMAKAAVPAAKKAAVPVLGAAAGYGIVGSGTTPADFTDPTVSSATTPPKQGSAQVAPAAVQQAAAPQYSDREKAIMGLMTSMSLPRLTAALQAANIGATTPAKPKDQMFQQLGRMLNEQYQADAATIGIDAARQKYLRGMMSVMQPSGVMYLPDEGQ